MQHQIKKQKHAIGKVFAQFSPLRAQHDAPKELYRVPQVSEALTTHLGFEPIDASIDELESMNQLLLDLSE
jgi:hypothetical protein